MRRRYTRAGIWSSYEEEYERNLQKEKIEEVEPDGVLAPGERYKRAILRMPRIRSEFLLRRISKSTDGLHLAFSGGVSVFEFVDFDDLVRDHQTMRLAFGGGLLEIEIAEIGEREDDDDER